MFIADGCCKLFPFLNILARIVAMKLILKYLFYTYVILLAGYFTYKGLMQKRWGSQSVSFPQPKQECFMGGTGWKYCVHSDSKTQPDTYLYVFHGKDEDEQTWMNTTVYSALLQKYWHDSNLKVPKVITISFGPVWLVTPRLSHKDTGLLERFQAEVFSKIEGHLGIPKQRFLLGESMGGLNVLSLTLHLPEYFTRVASLCPPLYSVTPYSSPPEILRLLMSSGAKPKALLTVLGIGRYLFKDDEEWKKFSPYHLLSQKSFRYFPSLYLTTGMRDDFGNYEGVSGFADMAKKKGLRVYWRPNSGDHCSIDAPSLGRFLSVGR